MHIIICKNTSKMHNQLGTILRNIVTYKNKKPPFLRAFCTYENNNYYLLQMYYIFG